MGGTRSVPAVKAYYTKQRKRLGLGRLTPQASLDASMPPPLPPELASTPASPNKVGSIRASTWHLS